MFSMKFKINNGQDRIRQGAPAPNVARFTWLHYRWVNDITFSGIRVEVQAVLDLDRQKEVMSL